MSDNLPSGGVSKASVVVCRVERVRKDSEFRVQSCVYVGLTKQCMKYTYMYCSLLCAKKMYFKSHSF